MNIIVNNLEISQVCVKVYFNFLGCLEVEGFLCTIKVKNSKIQDILDMLKTFNVNKSFSCTNINTKISTVIKFMCQNLLIYLHSNT